MTILPDSRQVPQKKEVTANKMYTDGVYAWLQVNSEWDTENKVRWIAQKDIKYTVIAEELDISRQTASTKFKKLLDVDEKGNKGLGLVTYNAKMKRYELKLLEPEEAFLVEKTTLRCIIHGLSNYAVSIYIYLLNRYIASGEQPYEFTMDQVKSFIGLSTSNRNNNILIVDILNILKMLGLLSYCLKVDTNGKTQYQVQMMRNSLPDIRYS